MHDQAKQFELILLARMEAENVEVVSAESAPVVGTTTPAAAMRTVASS